MEKTVIMIKPDAFQRKLVGEVIKRIEEKDLDISVMKVVKLKKKQVSGIYGSSLKKFPKIKDSLIEYMTCGPTLIMILEGKNAIKKGREIRGISDPSESPIGSVRRDFAGDQKMKELEKKGIAVRNLMHASGNVEEVREEIKLLFPELTK